jgi:hypothetical protein
VSASTSGTNRQHIVILANRPITSQRLNQKARLRGLGRREVVGVTGERMSGHWIGTLVKIKRFFGGVDAGDSVMRGLDDEDVLPYARPLDLDLILDGHDPDDMDHPPEDQNEHDGQESRQDGTGDGDGAEDDADDVETAKASEHGVREPWQVQLAERGDDGEWRLVGEPIPDATFNEMGLAHTYAENRNRRDFGQTFDWLANPPRAWRAGQLGTLKMSVPHGVRS